MSLVKEIEKVIADLPPQKASHLKHWLNEFKAARRYKKLKTYTIVAQALADFQKARGDASLN